MKQRALRFFSFLMVAMLLCSTLSATALAAVPEGAGKYYSDMATLDDALASAAVVAEQIEAEGATLLKNDGALPLYGTVRMSLFGVSQDNLVGESNGYVTLKDALEEQGFQLNPQLAAYYAGIATVLGEETISFPDAIEETFGYYSDVAVIVFSRAGGEGTYADNDVYTDEITDGAFIDGSTHAALHMDENGVHKHFLQMTDSEEELLQYVKGQGFRKIVYLINSSVPLEVFDLQQDDDVDAILWVGRPGQVGTKAVAGILSGDVNPSGKTPDIWYKDFTADPTWYNYGDNLQSNTVEYWNVDPAAGAFAQTINAYVDSDIHRTNYTGLDYEEDIYKGYRYYETKAADMNKAEEGSGTAWYQDAVVYPFGYGLSYTSFAYSDLKVVLDNGEEISDGAKLPASLFSSTYDEATGEKQTAQSKGGTAFVTVTNTGRMAGKETVELYITAPYDVQEAPIEKSHVALIAYEKTGILQPGESQTLEISFQMQDMASYDYLDANANGNKGYELEEGEYVLRTMSSSNGWMNPGQDYQEISFHLDADAIMALDDFSDNYVYNLFSAENGMYYSLRDNENAKYAPNGKGVESEKLMTRADGFTDSFPQFITNEEMILDADFLTSLDYFNNFTVENTQEYSDGKVIEGAVDADDYPWMSGNMDIPETWDQTGAYGYQLKDLSGISPYDAETILTEGVFAGMTGAKAWETFLNTLTYDDLKNLVGQWQQTDFAQIEMHAIIGADNSYNWGGTFAFPDNPILGATWNKELAALEGRTLGNIVLLSGGNTWWGAAVQVHRCYFAGRAHEYTAEDPILAGYQAGNQIIGAQSKGVNCYAKHCVLNDQEKNRAGFNPMAWLSEQNLREIYLKPFQIAAQECNTVNIMGGFARLGRVSINVNYNLITGFFREQLGREDICFASDMYAALANATPLDLAVRCGTTDVDASVLSGVWDAQGKRVLLGDAELFDETKEYHEGDIVKYRTVMNEMMGMNIGYDMVSITYHRFLNDHQGAWDEADVTGASVADVEKQYVPGTSEIQYHVIRSAATRILYLHANMATNRNGINFDGWRGSALPMTQGEVQNTTVAEGVQGDYSIIRFEVTDGRLPEGVVLNEDGTLSGTPVTPGEYTFTVTCSADNWVTNVRTFMATVSSAFTIDEVEGYLGEDFYAVVESDIVKKNADNETVRYYILSGNLPKGLEINEMGEIEGTPEETGTFPVTIGIDHNVPTVVFNMFFGNSFEDHITSYTYDILLTVEE